MKINFLKSNINSPHFKATLHKSIDSSYQYASKLTIFINSIFLKTATKVFFNPFNLSANKSTFVAV